MVKGYETDCNLNPYTVKFEEVVYVLHVFQKKSKHGIATPKQDIELIETGLKRAKEHHDQYYKQRLEEDEDERGN
ncbi:type II toxin-antitoxin system RelE/ParE family toxin [Rivularia sp. UHCC 0363]|uniref:type II toxin-antitoxin system RelE/ParE family toxin n=1 Tax=Rivularia sp. UHCC 0363 TaxID=3110244 RepID=UPI002B21FDCA|nr:type II toxin-antitoxin system RelE/ParE family toxin [Rivularia sp. UHCC 0363]MEA5598256.1 type II toxin-antitoxin system RelE/ParE family toxin [Rivularia sp. UHCC 0363]